jgi:hypothetical protein
MNTPPSGLARKPTVKVEKAASEPANGDSDGKNFAPNIKAAAFP